MHARVTTFNAQPDKFDNILKITRESILPGLKRHNGFKDFLYLTNDDKSKCVAVVLWDTEDDMKDGEGSEHYLLNLLVKATPLMTKPAVREHYEVGMPA